MPGLLSTLLNQAYSMPLRLVQTVLHVTEQVWQPMHLSRFRTLPICALTFIRCSSARCGSYGGRWSQSGLRDGGELQAFRVRRVEPVDLLHAPHDDELVAVGADGPVVVEAVGQLRVAADHVGRLDDDARHRVVD